MRRGHEIQVQDGALFQWLKEHARLTFELITGIRLSGRIVRFDRYCVLVETAEGRELLIYKHALSSVSSAAAAGTASLNWHRRPRAANAEAGRVVMVGGRR